MASAPAMMMSWAWCDLLPELISQILTHLFPADLARFRAVCRAWHSATRQHAEQHHEQLLPWIVIPNGSFCTIGDGGAFFNRIPDLPNNVTCLAGATDDGWLALDRTDDVFRRTNRWDTYHDSKFLKPRHDVKHKHTYLLHNPFSGKTVPLPRLDSIVGDVAETFEIRKVLMRSASPEDDLVVVTTNNRKYSIILCFPGKETLVLPYLRVFDVAFFKDKLYGITPDEDLVVFDLAAVDSHGRPKFKRVIRHELADGEEDPWSWLDDYGDDDNDEEEEEPDDDEDSFNGDDDSDEEEEEPDDDEDSFNGDDDNEEEEEPDGDEQPIEEYSFNGDGLASDGEVIVEDEEVPYEPKDYIRTNRCLVESCGGQELLMVRRQVQLPPFDPSYTRKVEIFKADMDAGKWVSITGDALAEGEALFLSRSFSKSTQVYGDIEDGCIYFVDRNEVFDTRSWACRPFSLPWQRNQAAKELLTWVFPPKLVV